MGELDRVFTKCAWRLIPFMLLLNVVSYLDRVNVGFAALTMNQDLGFSPSVFGFGAGTFFIGFCLFVVPSTVILERIGARRWISMIMAAWGVLSAAGASARDPLTFYVLRFLLGIAEAGFFPGMIFYLTLWFPQDYRARFSAAFNSGMAAAFIIGGPLSGVILGLNGLAGLHGWQWLFLLEGLPAAILALFVLVLLPDGPARAHWLDDSEKARIAARLSAEPVADHRDVGPALRDPRVLAISFVGLAVFFSNYGFQFWLPQIVQAMSFSNLATGAIIALVFAASMASMILWARASDIRRERVWHITLPLLFAALAFAIAGFSPDYLVSLIALSCASVGMLSSLGPIWSLTSSFLTGPAAAGGIALVVAAANVGGFLGPSAIGILKQETGGYADGMIVMALSLIAAAIVALFLGRAMAPRALVVTFLKR